MKYVRKNTVVVPRDPTYWSWERDGKGGYVRVEKPTKSYRSYSKWHIAHDKSQYFLGGRVVSLCGTLNIASQDAEVSEEEPKRGKRGYSWKTVCGNCAMVQKALGL